MLDPDANKSIDLAKMTTLINRAQLLLDLGVEAEKNLNGAINEIAVFISGYDVNGGIATWLDPELHRGPADVHRFGRF